MSGVTVDDYVAITGITEYAGGDAAIQVALDAACAEIQSLLSQTLTYVAGDVIELDGTGHQQLILPEVPVVRVNSVTINQGLDTQEIVTDYKIGYGGILNRRRGWPWGYGNITVDHDHGYVDGWPADIKNVAVQAARAGLIFDDPTLESETIAGYSYTRSSAANAVKQYSHVLVRYRLPRIPVP